MGGGGAKKKKKKTKNNFFFFFFGPPPPPPAPPGPKTPGLLALWFRLSNVAGTIHARYSRRSFQIRQHVSLFENFSCMHGNKSMQCNCNILAYRMEKQKASKLGPAVRRFLKKKLWSWKAPNLRPKPGAS